MNIHYFIAEIFTNVTPITSIRSSKSWKKKNKYRPLDDESDKSQSGADDSNYQSKRDSSPELARISALITRPPKQKSSTFRLLTVFTLISNHESN